METSQASDLRDRPSGIEGYLIAVSRGRPGLVPTLLRGLLSALAPVYCGCLKLYLLP